MGNDCLRQRVIRSRLDGGGERQYLLLLGLPERHDFSDARLALCQRASLIEGDCANATNGFQGVATFNQQTSASSNSQSRGNGRRR